MREGMVFVCVFGRSPRGKLSPFFGYFLRCPPYRRDSPGDIVVGKKDPCPPGDSSEDVAVHSAGPPGKALTTRNGRRVGFNSVFQTARQEALWW